jgi:hypothetical protein
MTPTGGFTGALSPDAVLTGIDGVMWNEYTREMQPGYIRSSDSFFFNQGDTVGVGFIADEDSDIGDFDKADEQEDFMNTDTWVGNQKTHYSQKYYKQIPVSDEAFRADMIGKRDNIGRKIGEHARQTQDKEALQNTYADAFAGSVNTTPDGQALASNSHVTLKGITVDNLETGALDPDNLWTAQNSLANQKGQDGDAGGHLFEGLAVPYNLYKTAKEVMNSTKEADSAENNLNIFETDFGQVRIGASIFLDSTYNLATYASTSYHLIGRNHQIARKVFYGLTTTLIPPTNSSNDTYLYRAKLHEVCYPGTWSGYLGSNGTT